MTKRRHRLATALAVVTTIVAFATMNSSGALATVITDSLNENTGGHVVIDSVDVETGLVRAHISLHDFLVDPATHDKPAPPTHASHWSWVNPTPPAALTTVKYYLHNHGGADTLSVAQIDRIHDAAAVWNTAGANIHLLEVGVDTAAEIHVHGSGTSGCGGGAIGCAEFSFFLGHNIDGLGSTGTGYLDGDEQHHMAGNVEAPFSFLNTRQVLTQLTRSDWYTGASAGGIGSAELDYMTVAIQEFGHHLGLAHPNETGGHPTSETDISPMNGGLPAGVTRRVLQPSDIAAAQHLYGVPEPSSFGLGIIGLVALSAHRRRQIVA